MSAALLFALCVTQADPADPAVSALAERALNLFDVPGCVVVVVQGDKAVHLSGHGRRRADGVEPPTPDDLYPLASCTKAFTTALLATLVDDGKLAWDDPVRKHWPEFHLSDPDADRLVTVRDLVSHRAGMAGHDLLWYRAPWPPIDAVARLQKLPPSYPFRSGFTYQSVLVTAAGRVAERAGGGTWAGLLQTRLLGPLRMRDAGTRTPDAPPERRAVGHVALEVGGFDEVPWYEQTVPNAAGSLHASGRDLVPWLRLLLAGGALDGRRVVRPESLAETMRMQTPIPLTGTDRALHSETVQMGYGMGWVVQDYRGRRHVAHGGYIDGFRVQITLIPDAGLAVAVLHNRNGSRMALPLSSAIVDARLNLPPIDWPERHRAILAAESAAEEQAERARRAAVPRGLPPTLPLPAHAGTYAHPAYGTLTLAHSPGGLAIRWNGFAGDLVHEAGEQWRFRDPVLGQTLVRFGVTPQGVAGVEAWGIPFTRQP